MSCTNEHERRTREWLFFETCVKDTAWPRPHKHDYGYALYTHGFSTPNPYVTVMSSENRKTDDVVTERGVRNRQSFFLFTKTTDRAKPRFGVVWYKTFNFFYLFAHQFIIGKPMLKPEIWKLLQPRHPRQEV